MVGRHIDSSIQVFQRLSLPYPVTNSLSAVLDRPMTLQTGMIICVDDEYM